MNHLYTPNIFKPFKIHTEPKEQHGRSSQLKERPKPLKEATIWLQKIHCSWRKGDFDWVRPCISRFLMGSYINIIQLTIKRINIVFSRTCSQGPRPPSSKSCTVRKRGKVFFVSGIVTRCCLQRTFSGSHLSLQWMRLHSWCLKTHNIWCHNSLLDIGKATICGI